MKKVIIAATLVFKCFVSEAQIVKKVTYFGYTSKVHELYYVNVQTGQKHGKYIEYKQGFDGLASEGTYNNGVKVGKWVFYIPLGNENNAYLTANYNNKGVLHGNYSGRECVVGCERMVGTYVNGKLDGKATFYYTEDPLLIKETCHYILGNLNGKATHFYKSGLIKSVAKYKNNVLIDTAFVYKDSKLEPRLSTLLIYGNGGELVDKINLTTGEDNLKMNIENLKTKYLFDLNESSSFEKWKNAAKLKDTMHNPHYYQENIDPTLEDYKTLIKIVDRGNFYDEHIPNNSIHYFMSMQDMDYAIRIIYKLGQSTNSLTKKFISDLKWEIDGHNIPEHYPLYVNRFRKPNEYGPDTDNQVLYKNYIDDNNLPDIEITKSKFSSPIVANWVIKSLFQFALLDDKINGEEEKFIQMVYESNL